MVETDVRNGRTLDPVTIVDKMYLKSIQSVTGTFLTQSVTQYSITVLFLTLPFTIKTKQNKTDFWKVLIYFTELKEVQCCQS